MAFQGWLETLEAGRWINDPFAAQRADIPTRQLATAARCGLPTPRTLVTDDPEAVRTFSRDVGGELVYKSLDDPFIWAEEDSALFLYCSVVGDDQLDALDHILPYPGLFQERLYGIEEFRVTVVGERVFAARTIVDQTNDIDWRRTVSSNRQFSKVLLDGATEERVLETARALGLVYGAFDLIRTVDDLYFLEVNTSGAYLWLEQALDMPITDALCDQLLS